MSKLTIHQGDLCFIARIGLSDSYPYILARDEKSGKQVFTPLGSFNRRELGVNEVSVYDKLIEVKYYQPDKDYYITKMIRACDVSRFMIFDFDCFEQRLEELNKMKQDAEIKERVSKLSKQYQKNLVEMADIDREIVKLREKKAKIIADSRPIIEEFSANAFDERYNFELLEDYNKNHPSKCLVYAKFPGCDKTYCWVRPMYLKNVYIVPGMKLKVSESGTDYPVVVKVEYSDKPTVHKDFISIVF